MQEYTLDKKDDGVQAMERLKSVYLLALVALAPGSSVGQTAPPDQNARTFAVVGDIENCNTFPVPTGTTLTVRQAVINAGLVSESVSVMVIRSTQDRSQWTQSVSATSSDDGEPVGSGDVLVVQSMSPLTAAVRKNAALRSDFGVAVVSLEQDGIVIGDVLQATNTLPPADGRLKVICRLSGRTPIAKAELYDPVVHGDVISVSRSDRAVLKGFGSMLPAVSEWKSGGTKAARDPFMPGTLPSGNHSLSSSQSMFQPLQLPTSAEPSMVFPLQDSESPEAATAETDEEKEEEIPTALVPALSIRQAEDVGDAGAADNKMSLAPESTAVAPIAPSEQQLGAVPNSAATAFNPWNLVFIGGLLLAGTLILAGTLKPEPEDDTTSRNTADRMRTSGARPVGETSASSRKWTESSHPLSVAMPVSQTAESLTKIEPAMRTDSAVRVAETLVARHEWFSGDCHGQIKSSADAIVAESLTQARPQNASTLADLSTVTSEIALSGHEHSDTVSEAESVKTLAADEQSFSDLEDLLQNRLPIDLCETQLPLRVALFGKPVGPGRLRIDAAHSTIPAPHMNPAQAKRREQTAAATNAAPAHTAAAQSSATDTPSVAESSGSLDRALHFLQKRTES